MTEKIVVAGDVSATNILMGVYRGKEMLLEEHYSGQEITDFYQQVFLDVLNKTGITKDQIHAAVLCPAGPISAGGRKCVMTQAGFTVDLDELQIDNAVLMNDFRAIAIAVLYDKELSLVELKTGNRAEGTKAVLGAGTGLGTARMFYSDDSYTVQDSEGGFRYLPLDRPDSALSEYISTTFLQGKKLLVDDLVSGKGIERIYEFYAKQKKTAQDIACTARDHPDSDEGKALNTFWKYYSYALRDLAIHELATGGIYAAGGIIRKHPEGKIPLLQAFTNNHRHQELLDSIPVFAITDDRPGLKGALIVACSDELREKEKNRLR